ncbi:response regulator [Candidatus Sumerlaeota bacterium]|nr:response regulator [Candidatus Sumerlaeota bacterium]
MTISNKRILVIDDEVRMCQSLQSLLMPWGYCVEIAHSGREGIEWLTQEEIHVVVTDLRMAEGSGYDVMKHVHENCPYTQVIVITGHASMESAVEALHHTVFDYITKPFEFDQLRASVERAFDKVEHLRLKDDLISLLTHDIKVPLTSIIGYSMLVFNKDTGDEHPKAREFVQAISQSAERILGLVDNFLATTKFDAGKLVVGDTPLDLNGVLTDLCSSLEMQIEQIGADFTASIEDDLPAVRGEESLIYRALSNLLNNAIHYAGQDQPWIRFAASAFPAEQSPLCKPAVRIEVANSGPGIPEESLPHIFDRYVRGPRGGDSRGTGLGLYAVRCILEAHDAVVIAESDPGKQTVFTVFLPAYAAETNE